MTSSKTSFPLVQDAVPGNTASGRDRGIERVDPGIEREDRPFPDQRGSRDYPLGGDQVQEPDLIIGAGRIAPMR